MTFVLSLRPALFAQQTTPLATAWLLADCMEFRGKQDLWLHQRAEILEALREQAMIQSTESSNRIEGVTVAPERLRPIVLGNSRPQDRSEEEVVGYRRALDWVFRKKENKPALEPATLLRLHALAQAGAGDAGKWKARDNEIIELRPDGHHIVRFRPTPAKDTPAAINQLCDVYNALSAASNVPPLLIAATAIFDFLCIHPFRDGNGRVSRLLTTLVLQQHGFVVSRYISLERLVEGSKDDYYAVLASSSKNWHEGSNEILPWWNYFLTILRRAYSEFADRVQSAADSATPATRHALVRTAALEMDRPFTLADIQVLVPSVSPALITKTLAALRKDGLLSLTGHGRSARWQRTAAKR